MQYKQSNINFEKLNQAMISGSLSNRIQVWDMLYNCLQDILAKTNKSKKQICAEIINSGGLLHDLYSFDSETNRTWKIQEDV